MNDTSNCNQGTSTLCLFLEVLEFHDREVFKGDSPVEPGTDTVELLLLLLETPLFDFILAEFLEVIGEAKLLTGPDEPLSRVILMPFNSVAIVTWEFVMEVVVSLTESNESGKNVVPWRVSVIERLISEPMSQGVDTECSLLNKEDPQDSSVDEATKPVTPPQTSNKTWEDETHSDNDLKIVLVLPDDDGILVQVGDVGSANSFGVLFHDHPSDVRVHQPLADRVWVLFGVGVSVMGSMITRPPSD